MRSSLPSPTVNSEFQPPGNSGNRLEQYRNSPFERSAIGVTYFSHSCPDSSACLINSAWLRKFSGRRSSPALSHRGRRVVRDVRDWHGHFAGRGTRVRPRMGPGLIARGVSPWYAGAFTSEYNAALNKAEVPCGGVREKIVHGRYRKSRCACPEALEGPAPKTDKRSTPHYAPIRNGCDDRNDFNDDTGLYDRSVSC